jgi:hypothetical protein
MRRMTASMSNGSFLPRTRGVLVDRRVVVMHASGGKNNAEWRPIGRHSACTHQS